MTLAESKRRRTCDEPSAASRGRPDAKLSSRQECVYSSERFFFLTVRRRQRRRYPQPRAVHRQLQKLHRCILTHKPPGLLCLRRKIHPLPRMLRSMVDLKRKKPNKLRLTRGCFRHNSEVGKLPSRANYVTHSSQYPIAAMLWIGAIEDARSIK